MHQQELQDVDERVHLGDLADRVRGRGDHQVHHVPGEHRAEGEPVDRRRQAVRHLGHDVVPPAVGDQQVAALPVDHHVLAERHQVARLPDGRRGTLPREGK
jgi:hypothetical protein